MPISISIPMVLAFAFSIISWPSTVQAVERYIAKLEDGTYWSGVELTDWHESKSGPRVGGRPLFGQGSPLRLIRDRNAALPSRPEAFIEFEGGDRFPGSVLRYVDGKADVIDRRGPSLLVAPEIPVDWPELSREDGIRVSLSWLRRVVWEGAGRGPYRPGTIFYRDGRRLSYRNLRWRGSALWVLMDDGTRKIPFYDLAEVHLPRRESSDAYVEQLARLSPSLSSRLFRVQSIDGLIATSSFERFDVRHHFGNSRRPETWYQLIQPAWSLDPLWIPFTSLKCWQFFDPRRPPLTYFEPDSIERHFALGGGWRPLTDRNVQGTALRCGEAPVAWGLGTHATTHLEYRLPEGARSFRFSVGLDEVSMGGGCARATVSLELPGEDATAIYRSPLLAGDLRHAEGGVLALGDVSSMDGGGTGRLLRLTVDSASGEEPEGGDPFNIRDVVDWVDPEIEFDTAILRAEVQRALGDSVAAWAGWDLSGAADGPILARNVWDRSRRHYPISRIEIQPAMPLLELSRRLEMRAEDRYLLILASRQRQRESRARLHIRFDAQDLKAIDAPVPDGRGEPRLLLFPLPARVGSEVLIEIFQEPIGSDSWVAWQSLTTVKDSPSVYRIFDEENDFIDRLVDGDGEAEILSSEKFSGGVCLRVSGGRRSGLQLLRAAQRIRSSPLLGEYRWLTFAWKAKAGRDVAVLLAKDGAWSEPDAKGHRHYGYFAGRGGRRDKQRVERVSSRTPEGWTVVTQDLFADHGSFTLSGMAFECVAGGHVLIDRIYLARSKEDFAAIREPGRIDPLARRVDRSRMSPRSVERVDDVQAILSEFAPGFSPSPRRGHTAWLGSWHGKNGVLRRFAGGEGFRLSTLLSVPDGKSTRLHLTIGGEPGSSYELVLRAAESEILREIIGTKKAEFREFDVELSQLHGREILLSIEVRPIPGVSRAAVYIHKLEVIAE